MPSLIFIVQPLINMTENRSNSKGIVSSYEIRAVPIPTGAKPSYPSNHLVS